MAATRDTRQAHVTGPKTDGAILVAVVADSARFGVGHQRPHTASDLRRCTFGDAGEHRSDLLLIRGFWVRSPGGPPF